MSQAHARMLSAHEAGEFIHPHDKRAWLPRQVEGWGAAPSEPWKLTDADLAELEELVSVDRMVNRHLIRPDVAQAVEWGDITGAVQALGYDGAIPDWSAERSRTPGLVSVPTSGQRSLRPSFDMLAASASQRSALRAFPLDQSARRVAQLRMQVGVAARLQCAKLDDSSFECLMVTLTYKGGNDAWEARHVADFMKHVRRWCQRRGLGCHYVWVAELQKRGVIHYHVALWVPVGTRLPKPDECGWWPHGMTRIEVARAAVPYLLKYLSKDTSKTAGKFPRGARIYGVGGLEHVERRTRRWLNLPGFVQARSDIHDKWVRVEGGGWKAPEGEHFPSEFTCAKVGGVRCLMRVHTHEREWSPDGPFTWLHRGADKREVSHESH
jgi:hypothetical protein